MTELDPSQLLVNYTVVRTTDPADHHAYIVGLEGQHQRSVADGTPTEIELRHASLGRVQAGLEYSSVAMSLEAARGPERPFILQFPLSSRVRLEVEGRTYTAGPDSGLVISPSVHVRRESDPGGRSHSSIRGSPSTWVRHPSGASCSPR